MNQYPVQVCYALATDGDTNYLDLIAISAFCVRRIYPDARITILIDEESSTNLGPSLSHFSGLASCIASVGRYVGNARYRSRFVKTQARNVLAGDFLYLDADTLPVAEFHELFDCDAPVSAAIDRNRTQPAGGFPEWVVPDFQRLGWPFPTEHYVNGGVMFWKDCDRARALGRLWHDNWLRYAMTLENPADQPSLNHSISALAIVPKIIDDAFNARIGLSSDFALGARIYHFYIQGDEKPEGTIIDALLDRYRQSGEVDVSLIDEAVRRGHPWIGELAPRGLTST